MSKRRKDVMIHHYSPLLKSTLSIDGIVIHTPLMSHGIFDVYQPKAFAFSVSKTVMTLEFTYSLVLVAKD